MKRQTVISTVVLAAVAGLSWAASSLVPRDTSREAFPGVSPLEALAADEVAVPPGDIATCATAFIDVSSQRAPCAAPALFEGVEICADHDKTRWHPLVKRDDRDAITCTYTHEHHDDPTALDDLFGPPSAWYGGNQQISYPWQTSGSLGAENDAKHQGYKWFVGRDIPCTASGGAPDDGCVQSYRVQIHARGDISDQTTRLHSFGMEVLLNYHGQVGLARHGGHVNTGFLALLTNGGNDMVCPPIETNPPTFTCRSGQNLRESGSVNVPAPHAEHANPTPNWYGKHAMSVPTVNIETWGPIDYTKPSVQLYYPPEPVLRNNSTGRIGIAFASGGGTLRPLRDTDGKLRLSRYTDRNGVLLPTCAPLGPDCIPLQVDEVEARSFILNARHGDPAREFDVPSPVTQKSLIKFPN